MKKFIVMLSVAVVATVASAQGVINDGDAQFAYTGGQGSADFMPDSTTDHMFQNYWWYRINGVSFSEQAFAFPATSQSYVGNVANLDWAINNGQPGGNVFTANMNIVLTDGAAAGQASLAELMTINNTSGQALSLSIFNYVDLDVAGTFGSDSAVISGDTMTITDGVTGDFVQYQGVGASAFQVTEWNILLGLLNNGTIEDYDNTGLPFGPGDFTGGFQWDMNLAAGESFTMNQGISVNTPVPEPASMIALGLGAAALLRKRRKVA